MTLYLKYRPKNLDELDLPQVAVSLKKILISKDIPHAFLFSGPKGTGKTSAARILAKVINCQNPGPDATPCDKCEQCISISKGSNLDVVEMDAASHRGIDDVRLLKDAVKLAPTGANKKIYIIDEAHMLTTEASNALLKTLEEPPAHVIFILATTNPEKLIDTIKSRTTQINFRKASTGEITKALKRVVDGEKIEITESILTSIAELSGGAFRDGIKMLEQYSLEGEEYLKSLKVSEMSAFIDLLSKRDEPRAIEEIEKNISMGVNIDTFTKTLLSKFHLALLAEVGIGTERIEGLAKEDLVTLSAIFNDAYREISNSPVEQLPVELAIIKWCGLHAIKKVEPAPAKEEISQEAAKESVTVSEVKPNTDTDFAEARSVNDDIWRNILATVKPINASIEGLLRASKPMGYDGKTLTLGVFYRFHKERLEDARHRKIVEDVMAKILNSPTRVVCTLVEPPAKKVMEEAKREPVLTESKDPDIIKAAEEIFGS